MSSSRQLSCFGCRLRDLMIKLVTQMTVSENLHIVGWLIYCGVPSGQILQTNFSSQVTLLGTDVMGGLPVLHQKSLVLLCVLVTLANISIQIDLDFFIFMYILNILFVCFWLWWVFVAAQASSVAMGRGCARAAGVRLFAVGASLAAERGSRARGARWVLPASSAQAQQCGGTDFAAPQQVGSSWIRDHTCVSCISMQVLYHLGTREAQFLHI